MPSLLFLDPATGERLTYEEILTSVLGERVEHAPAARPATPGAAVLALLRAVVLGRPLTLFDADFGAEEIARLGGSAETFAARESVPGIDTPDAAGMLDAARSQTGFRLTLFTSGSTGLPKRVTHGLEGLTRTLRVSDKHAANVWGLAYNPTHIAGVQVILQAFFNRNPLINLFQAGRSAALEAITRHGVTHLSATPSFYRLLLPVETPLDNVRAVTLGGERSDANLLGKVAALFPAARVRNLYASTEAGTLLVSEGDSFAVPENLADRVRIRDGQLEIDRSLLGETAGADRGQAPGAWYETGDRVEIVSENPLRFRFLGRDRDWVNVGGHKVDPHEVEAALLELSGVREARVYGRANSVLGQILCAEVVAGEGFDEPAARAWLAARLQPAKIPRLIKRVASLPRARTGKLERPAS